MTHNIHNIDYYINWNQQQSGLVVFINNYTIFLYLYKLQVFLREAERSKMALNLCISKNRYSEIRKNCKCGRNMLKTKMALGRSCVTCKCRALEWTCSALAVPRGRTPPQTPHTTLERPHNSGGGSTWTRLAKHFLSLHGVTRRTPLLKFGNPKQKKLGHGFVII